MRWNKERIDFIVNLAHSGLSHSQIARLTTERFGEAMTKGSIAGKLNRREDYVRREWPIGRRKPVLPPPEPAPVPCVAAAPCKKVWLPPEPAQRVAVRKQGYRADGSGCRFPIEKVGTRGYRFCDKPLSSIAASYCDDCKKIAYKPLLPMDNDILGNPKYGQAAGH